MFCKRYVSSQIYLNDFVYDFFAAYALLLKGKKDFNRFCYIRVEPVYRVSH